MITSAKITGRNVNPKLYHQPQTANRGNHNYIMSQSSLKDCDRCPSRWIKGYESPDSTAKDWGNIVDCLILTPDRFKDCYAVKPDNYTNEKGETKPWSGNANVCKGWIEDAEAGGREVVSSKFVREGSKARDAIMEAMDPDTKELADYINGSEKQVAIAGEWTDAATGLVIPARCLIDLAPGFESPYSNSLADFKTSRCAEPNVFVDFGFKMGYHIQAAMCLAMWNAATGEKRTGWQWIVQESFPPYHAEGIMIEPEMLSIGHQALERMAANYAKCLKSQTWPGYACANKVGSWSVVALKPWQLNQEFFAAEVSIETENGEKELPF